MAFAGTYSKLQGNVTSHNSDEEDLEGDESDTTKFSSTVEIYDKMHFLPLGGNLNTSTSPLTTQRRTAKRENRLNNFWAWLRFGVIVGLQTILILLLSVNQSENKDWGGTPDQATTAAKTVETGGDINGLYKTCKYHSFSRLDYSRSSSLTPNSVPYIHFLETRRREIHPQYDDQ
jgi:hypothetical protein